MSNPEVAHQPLDSGGIMATLDITRSIDIKAPTNKVWAALTQADLIAQWFGDTAEFDASPGAVGVFGWAGHGRHRVVVEDVDEPQTVGYCWALGSRGGSAPRN